MLVSVIIPTYNRALLLSKAIESCIAQTYRPIECIVVDDGSVDNTRKVVEELKEKESAGFSIEYIVQPNCGSQVARNTGTTAASGEFIQYLDSDDLLYPDKIANQVAYFKQHSDCDAVFGDWEVGTEEKKESIIAYKNDNLIEQFLTERCIHTLSILMRSSLIKKIGEWDVNVKRNQEIDFHLRGILAGGKFDYYPGLCGLWRQHAGDRIVSSNNLYSTQFFFEKWERKLNEKNLLSPFLSGRLSNLYKWIIEVNPRSSLSEIISFYQHAREINPSFRMFNRGKYFLLARIIGEKKALQFWHTNRNKNIGK